MWSHYVQLYTGNSCCLSSFINTSQNHLYTRRLQDSTDNYNQAAWCAVVSTYSITLLPLLMISCHIYLSLFSTLNQESPSSQTTFPKTFKSNPFEADLLLISWYNPYYDNTYNISRMKYSWMNHCNCNSFSACSRSHYYGSVHLDDVQYRFKCAFTNP
jgi:hypothetical protein